MRAESFRSRCPRWASRSPRAPCSNGTCRRASRSVEGDTVVEVSTDKVDAEVPAPASGVITKLLVSPDDTVQIGQALAEMTAGAAPSSAAARRHRREAPAAAPAGPPAGDVDGKRASPVARRAAAANGVDLSAVSGSGPGGKVIKADVLAAANGGDGTGAATKPSPPGPTGTGRIRASSDHRSSAAPLAAAGGVVPLRGPAGMLAQAMNESLSVPTATSFRTLPVDVLDAKRRALNGVLKERGMKVSFTHLVAWAIVQGGAGMAGDGPRLRGGGRQAAGGRARLDQPGDRRRRRAKGRLAEPDGALHQGSRRRRLHRLPLLLRGPDHQDA